MVALIRIPQSLLVVGLLLGVTFARPAQAGVIHVPGDYLTIQKAIDAAPAGSVILVAPGTYTGPLNTNLDFGGKALELRSTGGPEVTIIDCEFAFGHRGLRFHSGETASADRRWFHDHPGDRKSLPKQLLSDDSELHFLVSQSECNVVRQLIARHLELQVP